MNLHQWLKQRTFHHSKFSDLETLIKLKHEKQLSLSVCIPTLNEADTIGKTIKVLKQQLMEDIPLIDELVVIDSGSTDQTGKIVESHRVDFKLADSFKPATGLCY